jgi:hypothetical protein
MRILLAIDGSSCSDEAIEETSRRPWPEGSKIRVLTAFELPLPSTPEAWTLPPSYLEEMDRSKSREDENLGGNNHERQSEYSRN